MTVFTFSIALILVTSIVHVVIALQKDHIKRTGGDSIVDVIGVLSPKIFQIQGKQRTVAGEHRIFIGCHSCIRPLPPIPFLRSQKPFLHRSTGQWRNYF